MGTQNLAVGLVLDEFWWHSIGVTDSQGLDLLKGICLPSLRRGWGGGGELLKLQVGGSLL